MRPNWRRRNGTSRSRPCSANAVVPVSDKDDAKLSEAIGKLVSEDPSLTAGHDPETGAHVLSGQGALHLRRARETLASDFGVETEERPVTPAFAKRSPRRSTCTTATRSSPAVPDSSPMSS